MPDEVLSRGVRAEIAGGARHDRLIRFTLDGREVEAAPGESIWQVAQREGIAIPHLCWLPEPGYRADGNCRACMVEVEGERVLAASCIRKPAPGMKVATATERAVDRAADGDGAAGGRSAGARRRARSRQPALGLGRADGASTSQPLPGARPAARPTCRIRRWRCSSTPASSAICACAPAARSRSTT